MIDLGAACRCTAEELAQLSDLELVALADVVGKELGCEVVKQGERETAIERRLAVDLNEQFDELVLEAVEAELPDLPDVADASAVDVMLGKVTDHLAQADTSGVFGSLAAAIGGWASVAKRGVRRILGRRTPKIEITGSLTQADQNAIETMALRNVFWVGEFWDVHLSSRISATVSQEALATGLGRREVGRIIAGVISGEFPGVAAPGTWAGSSSQYFEMLSGTVRNVASNFGSISAMEDGQIQTYVVTAVMDERTSEICRFMNGRTFTVRDGRSHVDRLLGASDPEEVKSTAPWVSAAEAQTIAGGGDAASQRAALASGGLAAPPYHGRCRTVLLPA